MQTPQTKEFIKLLSAIDRNRSMRDKFRDFCELAYCAFANKTAPSAERADELEARYMRTVDSYRDKDDVRKYPELLALATLAVDAGEDVLGVVAGEIESLNKHQGQFFTPMPVCRIMAMFTLDDLPQRIEKKGFVTIGEPACGAGALILAAADLVEEKGFDPAIHMLVHAVDLNPLAYQMCFLQLNMRGVPAYVEHGNSLSMEHFDGAWTLPSLIFHRHHGHLFPKHEDDTPDESQSPIRVDVWMPATKQLSMFD